MLCVCCISNYSWCNKNKQLIWDTFKFQSLLVKNLQCLSWFMIFLFSFWISAYVSNVYSFIPTSLNIILLEFATNFRLLIVRLQNGRVFSVKRRIWLVIKPIFVVLNMKIWVVFEANKGQPCTLHQSNITWPGCGGFLYKKQVVQKSKWNTGCVY